jgi:transcriptional regulator with XRE-family HTH domain
MVFPSAGSETAGAPQQEGDMLIQKLRLKRGWSQQQLAEASGLSARTIQRVEAGQPASTETLKSIAAVFEVDFATLNPETAMTEVAANPQEQQEKEAFHYVRKLRRFYLHLFQFIVFSAALLAANLIFSPRYLWSLWAIGGWGLALLVDAFRVFQPGWVLGPDWERRQVEKRLGRPL